MVSDKAKTNKKWTSSERYRDNYDEIFGVKPPKVNPDELETVQEPTDRLGEALNGLGRLLGFEAREKARHEMIAIIENYKKENPGRVVSTVIEDTDGEDESDLNLNLP